MKRLKRLEVFPTFNFYIIMNKKGEELVRQIEAGVKKDKLCWQWVMYCAGDSNSCQRKCGEIGKCMEGCQNKMLPNNQKNELNSHLSSNVLMILYTPQINWLSLTRQVRDNIIINHRADHKPTKNIKAKMLASHNGANEEVLREALNNQKEICDDKKLYKFLVRYILYYQQPDLSAETSSEHFYQLTLSDRLWLKYAQRYGRNCIGIDSKYDLNNDTPVLAIVAENSAGFGPPLAFGLSNKEIIGQPVLDRTILCWFHVMQTFGKNLNNWKVPWPLRYPIALAFK
ncbi:unnamed protein product [Rhizophagus irregularis]|nr:unnamed protein product [Rhizophagus irregularis]